MGAGELLQNFRAMVGQFDIDLAPVLHTLFSNNKILFYRSINQAYSAVVSDMKLFSQLADRDTLAAWKSLDGQ
jgi:hypothetical protein